MTADLTYNYTKNESYYTNPFQVGASLGLGSLNPYQIHYQIKEGEAYLDIAKQQMIRAYSGLLESPRALRMPEPIL